MPSYPDTAGQAPSSPRNESSVTASALVQRRIVVATSVGIIVVMLCSLAAFLWHERQLALDETGNRAMRRAQRMAQDLKQSLTVAQAVIGQVDAQLPPSDEASVQPAAQPWSNAFDSLLSALPLPFGLHAIGTKGNAITIVGMLGETPTGIHPHQHPPSEALVTAQWSLSETNSAEKASIIPLVWKAAPNGRGVAAYGVDLPLSAVIDWLDRDRMETDDRASLFWMNADGTATLLARAPHVATDLGKRVRAPWVDAAQRASSGVLDQLSVLDGMPRLAAFQRLDDPAGALVLVYGAGTHNALAPWRDNLPYFLAMALALTAAMAYGAWRLNRSLRALTQSQRHFQLVLDSGNVWDWDIGKDSVRYAHKFVADLGYPLMPEAQMAKAVFDAMMPEDRNNLRAALLAHIKEKKPFTLVFRCKDAQGNLRWFDTKGQAFWDVNGRAQYMAGTAFEITERIALEERQRQTLQRLDAVANASSVLFWTSHLSGEVNWVNQRSLAFIGNTVEQSLGHGWMQAVHPEDAPKRTAFLATLETPRDNLTIEYRLRNAAGEFRWIMEQCLPLLDADQHTTGFIGSCVDITELRQAEGVVRQRGAMLEAMFDVMQDLLFVIDQEGRFVNFHGAKDERLIAPPEVFLGKRFHEVLPAPIANLLSDRMCQAAANGLQEFEYQLTLADGDHHFDARMAQLPGSEQFMVLTRDITERETLKKQRARLERFLILQLHLANRFINHPLDTIDCEIDRALGDIGEFVQADRAYIFKYNMQAFTADNTHEWCAPGIEPAIAQLQGLSMDLIPDWLEAHKKQQAFWVDDVQALPEGSLRDLLEPQSIRSLITLPMTSAQGLIGVVGFDSVRKHHSYDQQEISLLQLFAEMLVNVQERKQAEAKLRELADELEIRVKDRTLQLGASVKRLSQANRELESFAYSVSHDLKSPLRGMEGFAALLIEEHAAEFSDQARNYLERIQAATQHMGRLINDLLIYARIEQLEQGLIRLPLEPVVFEVVKGMRNEIDAKGAEAHLNIDPEIAALAHPQGLAMVLRNLIDNALKFAQHGKPPHINIRAMYMGPLVRLSVADDGQGFDMRYHDRIFAIFQRLHRSDEAPGTGIGLAMVHKAVERMDGRIWADSKPGQGATFHIELPRA